MAIIIIEVTILHIIDHQDVSSTYCTSVVGVLSTTVTKNGKSTRWFALLINQYKHFNHMHQMNIYKELEKNLSTLLWVNVHE